MPSQILIRNESVSTMQVRVLGCSGAIARDCRTTSFLIDGRILIDAGTGVGDLTLAEMQQIDTVLLTHSHLDHIAALPLMLDAIGAMRQHPLQVMALRETICALQQYIFNNVIWPDFSQIPSKQAPFFQYQEIQVGQQLVIDALAIEVLPAVHTVPAVGYAVLGDAGWWVFSGDTGPNPAFWKRINQLPVAMLVLETAFSNRERQLAELSQHLSPHTFSKELAQMDSKSASYPIYITHTKPSETEKIMKEIDLIMEAAAGAATELPDVLWLKAGDQFTV
jgi:ribonuclease BN (tRNA processing enzyme)